MTDSRKSNGVVGSINMDMVAHSSQIPVAGQTVIGTGFDTTPGGKGANQAVAAARLGYPVAMVGAVGAPCKDNTDVFGQVLLDKLASAGVRTEAVVRIPGPSGVASIIVAENGENSIVVIPGANGKMDSAAIDLQAALIRSAGMVLCQLELPIETVAHTLALCAQASIPVILDPAPAAPLPDAVFHQIAWFTPNETEAAFYLGEKSSPGQGPPGRSPQTRRGRLLRRHPGQGRAGEVLPRPGHRFGGRGRLLQLRVCRGAA
jgi:ribokinase